MKLIALVAVLAAVAAAVAASMWIGLCPSAGAIGPS